MITRPFGTFQLNRSNPITRGLVLWAPLVELTPVDRVGRLVLTPTNTPLIIRLPERVGWAFVTASTQYFLTSSTPVTAVPLTINAWFYPTQVASTKDIVSICNSADALNFFQLQHAAAAGVRARSGDSGGTSNATSSTNVVVNTWQMATGVWLSATSRSAYLNAGGKLTSTGSRTPTGVNRIGLGAQVSSSVTSAYGGYLADVGLWNRALGDDEIVSLYLDPWQLTERINKNWSIPLGTVYSNSLSLAVVAAETAHGYLTANSQVALHTTAAVAEGTKLDGVGHTAIGATATVSNHAVLNGVATALLTFQTHVAEAATATLAGSLAVHQTAGLTLLSNLQALAHESLTAGLTLTEHAALTALQHQQLQFTATISEASRGTLEGSITLPLTAVALVQDTLHRQGSLTLGVNETVTTHSVLGANGHVQLASAVAIQLVAGLSFLNHVELHSLHQVLTTAVLDAFNQLYLAVDPAMRIDSIVIDTTLVTPENRRLVVSLDSRKLTVAGEDRRFFVPAEYRKFLVRKKP